MIFDINNFFEIKSFLHKIIFENFQQIWTPLEKLSNYLETANLKSNRRNIQIPSTCYIENPDLVFIGENTSIEPYVYIKGPCIIGANSEIRHGAYIRENVITGKNCIIGHATEIKNSILLDDVSAAHFAYIGDSIIGNRVNIGAGVKLANFRLDKNEICFYLNSEKIKTNLDKLGSIIGDDTQIGCNTVLNPGTFLEKNIKCMPSLNIGGYITKNSIIKNASSVAIKKSNSRVLKNEFTSKN
ncbi:MAG: Bifunctional protein GlmU [Candidatus Anoxychlamydiales bacterium]|nr:Bifunctional protein GlmU [Candidatus Anoxychlamydiales bacterium]HEU64727.1 UDP-N-acetylglucosamine diphosphorylase [Chlamydiota bacterium]